MSLTTEAEKLCNCKVSSSTSEHVILLLLHLIIVLEDSKAQGYNIKFKIQEAINNGFKSVVSHTPGNKGNVMQKNFLL